jgi:hypothetical protein
VCVCVYCCFSDVAGSFKLSEAFSGTIYLEHALSRLTLKMPKYSSIYGRCFKKFSSVHNDVSVLENFPLHENLFFVWR